jgi:hypothetical protein
MGGLYDILEAYRQQNDPRFIYEGLYEEPAYTGPNIDPMYNLGARQFGNMNRMDFGVPQQATGIMQQEPTQNFQQAPTQNFEFLSSAYEDDDAEQVDSLTGEKKSGGILDLIMSVVVPGYNFLKNAGDNFKQDPRATGIRNFYSPEGLTSTGSIASGIMKGYNPISGGALNFFTGGKFGQPTNYGLSRAMQKRIENIVGRKAPQTDISRSRVAELRNLQRAEMEDRSNRGESLGSIGRSTFSGPGMAFERKSGGVSGKGTANERNYGGR